MMVLEKPAADCQGTGLAVFHLLIVGCSSG